VGEFQEEVEIPVAFELARKVERLVIPVILPQVQGEPRIPVELTLFNALDLRRERKRGLERLTCGVPLKSRQFEALESPQLLVRPRP
jgi:hypothetical protein